MKIKKFFKHNLEGIKKGFSRFPLAIISSIALSSLLVYSQFTDDISASGFLNSGVRDSLYRVFTVSIFMFIFISLLNEYLSNINKNKFKLLSNIVGIVLMVPLFLYTNSQPSLYSGRISIIIPGLVIIFIILSLFIECITDPKNVEYYIYEIIKSSLISVLFAGVILVGVELILFALSTLFFNQVDYRFYSSAASIILIAINLLVFVSYFPNTTDLEKTELPIFLKILIGNIVTILVSIFGVILYIYFIMILIQRQMPVNRISYLVIIFGSASITLLILLNLIKRNNFTKIFSIIIPISIIPLAILMFLSMWTRINNYGITENRYFVIVIGIWILISVIYFLINRYKNNIPIFIMFSIITLFSIIGPLSAYDISLNSQVARLEHYFNKNNMLTDGKIQPNELVSKEDKLQISSILLYFQSSKDINDVKYINKIGDSFFINPKKYLGFDIIFDNPDFPDNSINFYREIVIVDDISEYNKMYKFNMYDNTIGDYKFSTKDDNLIIQYKDSKGTISIEDIRNTIEILNENDNLEFTLSIGDKNIKIIFTDLYYYFGENNSISGTAIILEK